MSSIHLNLLPTAETPSLPDSPAANPTQTTMGVFTSLGTVATRNVEDIGRPFRWFTGFVSRFETWAILEGGGGIGLQSGPRYSASIVARIANRNSWNGIDLGLGCATDNPCRKGHVPLTAQVRFRLPGGQFELYGGIRGSKANGGVNFYFFKNPLYVPAVEPEGASSLPESPSRGPTGFDFHPEYDPEYDDPDNLSTEKRVKPKKRVKPEARSHPYRVSIGAELFETSSKTLGGALSLSGWAFGFNGVGVSPTLRLSGDLNGDITAWGLVSFSIYGSGQRSK